MFHYMIDHHLSILLWKAIWLAYRFLIWQMVLPWTSCTVCPTGNCPLALEGRRRPWLGSNNSSKNILSTKTLTVISFANMVGVKWYFLVSSICVFLVFNKVRHLFMFTNNVHFLFTKHLVALSLSFSLLISRSFLWTLDSNPTLAACCKYLLQFCTFLLYL